MTGYGDDYEMEEGDRVYLCESPFGTRYVRVTNDKNNVDVRDRGVAINPRDGDWRSIEAAWVGGASERECAALAGDEVTRDYLDTPWLL